MSTLIDSQPTQVERIGYASFGSRINALFFDFVVLTVGALALIIFAAVTESIPGTGRVAVIGLFALFFLYEPIMVWRFGGTIGHQRANLRVVDDVTGRAPTLPRALARYVIKAVLGLLSFATMAVTRRHQAMHDSLTRTTVQIRDLTIAPEVDVRWEREIAEPTNMPSRGRRVAVIVGYVLLSFIALGIALDVVLSERCFADDYCSPGERVLSQLFGLTWVGVASLIIITGWRGRLWGARRSRSASA